MLTPGVIIQDRYRIEAVAGKGGMGTVYKAEDLKLRGKKWAIKAVSGSELHHLHKEAELMMRLDHPHLPHIVDYVTSAKDHTGYLIMEWIEGETLQRRFERAGYKLSVQELVSYAVQICDCLTYLHSFSSRPVVYRDLNPLNIMLDPHGLVRLIDFGIARDELSGNVSKAGTRGFASPEQMTLEADEDQRTDIYNLGALMYYLLSGGLTAEPSSTPSQLKHSLATIDAPDDLIQIVMRCLQHEPHERYQTATAIRQDLMQLQFSSRLKMSEFRKKEERIVVVGGLSQGAGATFTALALAAVFDHYGTSNALVEWPTDHPELFHTLYGERHAPAMYSYWIDERPSMRDGTRKEWGRGNTMWCPLPPNYQIRAEDNIHLFSALGRIETNVKIIDIGDQWEQESVKQLCKMSDSICMVADPFPGKFNALAAQAAMKKAIHYKQAGKEVVFIANRWNNTRRHRDWLRSFPWKPEICLPLIDYEVVFNYAWKGEIVHDNRSVAERMNKACSDYVLRQVEQNSVHSMDIKSRKSKSFV